MAAARQTNIPPPDDVQIARDFSGGIVRDMPRHLIPEGAVYDSVDFFLHEGRAWKRGGSERHSAILDPAASAPGLSAAAVATIHIPTRVVAVDENGRLFDVTSESGPQATEVGAIYTPAENPPLHPNVGLIFCDPAVAAPPKKVYTTGALGTVTIGNLGGSPPIARYSTIYGGRIVLARGANTADSIDRLYFSDIPNVESSWSWVIDPLGGPATMSWIDTDYEITGLASVSGVLLVFSPVSVERILHGIPPGVLDPDSGVAINDMELQPLANVGCLDARSIVHFDEQVVFAGEEGVWITNGSGVDSLTAKKDGSGIQSYWRSLFPPFEARQVIGGALSRQLYIVTILDELNQTVDTLVCYLPTACWTRMANVGARMYAQGRTEQETLDLYAASNTEPYVNRLGGMLTPDWNLRVDANGINVQPYLELRPFGDALGLVAFGFGRVTYEMLAELDHTTPGDAVLHTSLSRSPIAEEKTEVALLPETGSTVRARFEAFMDSQAVTVSFEQIGPSRSLQILSVEMEARPYPPGAEVDFAAGTSTVTEVAGVTVHGPFPFAFNTPGLNNGVNFYTPTVGDLLLDAWIEVTTAFNGTTPNGDIGTYVGTSSGLFAVGAPIPLTGADSEGAGGGLLVNLGAYMNPSLVGASASMNKRVAPARFTAANPLKLVISQTGLKGGAAIGGTAGAVNLYIVTGTPVAS